jgi:uncharacterized protein (DUF1330 family)
MKTNYRIAAAIIGSFALGVGVASVLHAQGTAPVYGVAEINVRDEEGYKKDFLPKAQELIKEAGGKYLAGGFNKTTSYTGFPAASRYVIILYPSADAWNKLWSGGLKELQDKVGNKYGDFRILTAESIDQK